MPKFSAKGPVTGVRGAGAPDSHNTGPTASARRPTGSESPYQPGVVIAEKYELVRMLDRGGMGVVWVAHHRILDVQIGLKLISLSEHGDPMDMAQRLLDEARSAARIDHPAIVRVQDFGQTDWADPYLVMELLDGEHLGGLLEREPRLEPIQAVRLLLPIIHALATAHEKNIIHRDVKPENIFLAKDPGVGLQPKLLDFGIARMVDSPRRLTIEGSVLGTPAYMSPEQARGEPVDAASDQWSLCVVLYEIVAGTIPFDGPNYHALLRSIIEEAPPTLAAYGIEEPKLWSLISRGLAKDSTQRWSSIRELGERLARWLLDQGVAEDITGTLLQRSWFRDPENTSWSDISQLTNVSDLLRASSRDSRSSGAGQPEGDPTGTGARVSVSGVGRASSAGTSTPGRSTDQDLAALAELSRGGDPLEVFLRAERRRRLAWTSLYLLALLGGAVALLAGAGLLGV